MITIPGNGRGRCLDLLLLLLLLVSSRPSTMLAYLRGTA